MSRDPKKGRRAKRIEKKAAEVDYSLPPIPVEALKTAFVEFLKTPEIKAWLKAVRDMPELPGEQ